MPGVRQDHLTAENAENAEEERGKRVFMQESSSPWFLARRSRRSRRSRRL